MNFSFCNVLFPLALALAPFSAFAATEGAPAAQPATTAAAPSFFESLRWITQLDSDASWQTPSDIKGRAGELSAWSYSATAGFHLSNDSNVLIGALDYRYTDFDFHGVSAAPFGNMERLRLFLHYEHMFTKRWGFFVDGSGTLAAERSASLLSGGTGRIGAGVRFKLNSKLTFFSGVMVTTFLEDRALPLPFAGASWQITPRWSLNILNGVMVSCDVFEDRTLRVDLGCTIQGGNYRLAKDQSAYGARRTRALEIWEVPLTLRVTHEFGPDGMGYVRASVGGVLYSRYRFRSSGHNIDDFGVDPAAVFKIEVGVRF
ncbi:MAG: hypothetical protein LBV54_07575 [Puniceicoccales bacterium]|nr:hypothetical protein [Puniceicoccales bacterium]